MCVCPSDWAHMCTPAVVGLQEHLNTLFILPVHTHTHTHAHYTADRVQVQLSIALQYIVCVRRPVTVALRGFMSSE